MFCAPTAGHRCVAPCWGQPRHPHNQEQGRTQPPGSVHTSPYRARAGGSLRSGGMRTSERTMSCSCLHPLVTVCVTAWLAVGRLMACRCRKVRRWKTWPGSRAGALSLDRALQAQTTRRGRGRGRDVGRVAAKRRTISSSITSTVRAPS